MSKKHLPVKGCEECEEFKTICVECLENETQDELKEEILENLFNEEYDRLEKEHPQFNPMAIAIIARCYATKRWEVAVK